MVILPGEPFVSVPFHCVMTADTASIILSTFDMAIQSQKYSVFPMGRYGCADEDKGSTQLNHWQLQTLTDSGNESTN